MIDVQIKDDHGRLTFQADNFVEALDRLREHPEVRARNWTSITITHNEED